MTEEHYIKNEDGSITLVETIEIEDPSNEELISEKEAKLLEIHAEIEALRAQQ